MDLSETILGIFLLSGVHVVLTCIPAAVSLAIGKRKLTVGAAMLWVAGIGGLLVPLKGSMGMPAIYMASYGCYLLTILAAGIHVSHPFDKYFVVGWITVPILMLSALALFVRSQF